MPKSAWGKAVEIEPVSNQLGKYRLVATLGQGGMGTVYLALASGLGQFQKLLVIKELRQDLTRKESFVRMFMDEAKLAARLSHPNVVQTIEAGHELGRYFLAMEYLDGQPLSAVLDRFGRGDDAGLDGMPLAMHIQILCEVLSGLHYAHELRDYDGASLHVVHRDISPQNVFVTYHGEVKVVDFGVAKAANASNLTSPGVFKGKFAYAAPEQTMGRPIDRRTDVFAAGVMLWEAIANRRFAEGLPSPESFAARSQGKEPRIAEVVPSVEPLLAEICDRALAVDPQDRFPSAEALRVALQQYLALQGERIEASQIGEFLCLVFEEERLEVHRVIEKQMKGTAATDSSVEALPFFDKQQAGGDGATTVADLSDLVQVTGESDDSKIQQAYLHSKITPLRPGKLEPRFPRWAIAAIAAGVALAVVIAVLMHKGSSATATLSKPPETGSAQPPVTAPSRPAPVSAAPVPQAGSVVPPVATNQNEVPKTTQQASADTKAANEQLRNDSVRNRRTASPPRFRERKAADATRSGAPAAASAEGKAAEQSPRGEKPAQESVPSMGTDLQGVRRSAGVRIDLEDPYK